jgi:hypothetical protein
MRSWLAKYPIVAGAIQGILVVLAVRLIDIAIGSHRQWPLSEWLLSLGIYAAVFHGARRGPAPQRLT